MTDSSSISATESLLQGVSAVSASNQALLAKSAAQSQLLTPDGALPSGTKKRSESASHKVIEKRRRDRINKCLGELSKLIPAAFVKQQGTGKLEKAEILEMTVEHLRSLQQAGVSKREENLMQEASPEMILKYRSGFNECASEVAKFLSSVEGIDTSDPRFVRLLNHLQAHGNRENVIVQAMANATAALAASVAMTPAAAERRAITENAGGSNGADVNLHDVVVTATPVTPTTFPASTISNSFAMAAQMAAFQQSFFQQQLAASALQQSAADQSQRQSRSGAPSLQHAQAQAAAAAAAMQIPAYSPYGAASPAAALFPLAAAAALNPRLAFSNPLFAGLLSPAAVCSLPGMTNPVVLPTAAENSSGTPLVSAATTGGDSAAPKVDQEQTKSESVQLGESAKTDTVPVKEAMDNEKGVPGSHGDTVSMTYYGDNAETDNEDDQNVEPVPKKIAAMALSNENGHDEKK